MLSNPAFILSGTVLRASCRGRELNDKAKAIGRMSADTERRENGWRVFIMASFERPAAGEDDITGPAPGPPNRLP
jgi:hypothetical protein